jgi:hypothetical protein
MLAYLHPVSAALVLAALAWIASLGVKARNDRRNRAKWLALHRRVAPWVYAGILLSWLAGYASTWWLRPEAELATSGHYPVGIAMVAVLSVSFLSSRWMDNRTVRDLHPWVGVLALLLSAAQVFFGLQILP